MLRQGCSLPLLAMMVALNGCGDEPQTAEAHALAARQLLDEGKQAAAAVEFKNAVTLHPRDPALRWQLGALHLELGQHEAAVKELTLAQAFGGYGPALATTLLRAKLAAGRFKEVAATTRAWRAQRALTAEQQLIEAQAQFSLGEFDLARTLFAELLRFEPTLRGAALLGLARLALAEQDLDTAAHLAREATAATPSAEEAWTFLGGVALKQNDAVAAQRAFETSLKLDPQLAASFGLTRALIAQRDFDAAERVVQRLGENARFNPLANFLTGLIELHRGDYATARTAFAQVLGAQPNHAPSLFYNAIANVRLGNFREAATDLTVYARQEPSALHAQLLLATLQLKLGDPLQANKILAALPPAAQDDTEYLLLAGRVALEIGDKAEGRKLLERASKLTPQSERLRLAAALGELDGGESEIALEEIERLANANDRYDRSDDLLMAIYLQRREFDQALALAQRLIARHPNRPEAAYAHGAALVGVGRQVEAIAAFKRAVALEPKFLAAFSALGNIAFGDGDYAEAKSYFERGYALDAANVSVTLGLARTLMATGESNRAVEMLTALAAREPGSVDVQLALAAAYLQAKRTEAAVGAARQALALAPNVPQVRNTFAQILVAAGDPKSALPEFEIVLQANEDDVEVKLALARAALAAGQGARAKQVFDEVYASSQALRPLALQGIIQAAIQARAWGEARTRLDELRRDYPKHPAVEMLRRQLTNF